MSGNPATATVKAFLNTLAQGSFADQYIDPDLVYISLNHHNPELAQIMPWAGTHRGAADFKKFFDQMLEAWEFLEFKAETMFGEGEQVAVFGRFAYESKKAKRVTKSPFAIYLKVKDERITHFQFFEDTYDTAASFRRSGQWRIENAAGSRSVGE